MKNIMILGVEEAETENLRRMIMEMEEGSKIYTVRKTDKAYQIALERNIDLFLVDVSAGEKRTVEVLGMVFIGSLRELPQYYFTPVIFLSSLEEVEMYAYTVLKCYGYVERPYSMEKLEAIIGKALMFPGVEKKTEYVFFRNKGIFHYFRKTDIVYIENIQRKVWIHTVDKDVELSYITCQKILNHLDSKRFLQCSKNTIVNMEYIENVDYTNRYLEVRGRSEKLEIGSVLIKQFRKEMKEYCYVKKTGECRIL
ncbi:MAG: LytTR family transcriptional regulator DNA-binding domain-containing protein [Lachnospiraceae bacterium]|nr:LytTR family transcriptional regulator DNA-binding domain-containing protein [Lachnospiraceae bacterium]